MQATKRKTTVKPPEEVKPIHEAVSALRGVVREIRETSGRELKSIDELLELIKESVEKRAGEQQTVGDERYKRGQELVEKARILAERAIQSAQRTLKELEERREKIREYEERLKRGEQVNYTCGFTFSNTPNYIWWVGTPEIARRWTEDLEYSRACTETLWNAVKNYLKPDQFAYRIATDVCMGLYDEVLAHAMINLAKTIQENPDVVTTLALYGPPSTFQNIGLNTSNCVHELYPRILRMIPITT